jgi:hypothetical protein
VCGLFVERESCSSYYDCRKKKDGEEHTRKLIDVFIIIIPQSERKLLVFYKNYFETSFCSPFFLWIMKLEFPLGQKN